MAFVSVLVFNIKILRLSLFCDARQRRPRDTARARAGVPPGSSEITGPAFSCLARKASCVANRQLPAGPWSHDNGRLRLPRPRPAPAELPVLLGG